MKIRPLGKSNLSVTSMAYGCWRLAGSEGHPPFNDGGAIGAKAVLSAVEAGFRFFDLADIYGGGDSERIFGAALRQCPVSREQLIVATKCGIRRAGDPGPNDSYRYDSSRKHILRSVDGSLSRMGIDYIDLLMIHRPDYLMSPTEVAEAFEQLARVGKVRTFGVSNFRPSQVALLQAALPMTLAVHQIEFSLHQTSALDDGLLEQCLTLGITPMAWSPLDKGHLGDAPLNGIGPGHYEQRMRLRSELDGLAAAKQTERASVALAWLLAHPAGVVPVIGSVNPDHIRAAAMADALSLSREEWYGLTEAAKGGRLP
jgi:predicted oxidoreductase